MKSKRDLRCAYLYSNGTLVKLFEEYRNGIKVGESAELEYQFAKVFIAQNTGEYRHTPVVGRIIFHSYDAASLVTLIRNGRIEVNMPDLRNGSENTRKQGLAIQYTKVTTKAGLELHWNDIPSIISTSFDTQASGTHVLPSDLHVGSYLWDDVRICKITGERVTNEVTVWS